jgi:hypothetical protein
MTIRDIERVIAKLPQRKLAAFRAWFFKFDGRAWDKQFKEDAQAGKFDSLANEAIRDFNNGKCRTW